MVSRLLKCTCGIMLVAATVAVADQQPGREQPPQREQRKSKSIRPPMKDAGTPGQLRELAAAIERLQNEVGQLRQELRETQQALRQAPHQPQRREGAGEAEIRINRLAAELKELEVNFGKDHPSVGAKRRVLEAALQEAKQRAEARSQIQREPQRREGAAKADDRVRQLEREMKELEQQLRERPDARELREKLEVMRAMRAEMESRHRLEASQRESAVHAEQEARKLAELELHRQEALRQRERAVHAEQQARKHEEQARKDVHKAHEVNKDAQKLEQAKVQLKNNLQEIAHAYRSAEGEKRQDLRRKFEAVASELVKLHQQELRQQAERLEQQLHKIREELERGRERGEGLLDKIRKEMLDRDH